MLQALLKFTAFAVLVRLLKPRFRGLLFSGLFIGIALIAHAEYIAYVGLAGDTTYLAQSYSYKWLVITIVIFLYLLVVERRLYKCKSRVSEEVPPTREILTGRTQEDGLDYHRRKQKLTTRGERLIKGQGSTD